MDAPVSTDTPPQLPEYHFQEAPVPSEPPDKLNVVVLPEQIVSGVAEALDGTVDNVFTITEAVLTGAAEPHKLLAVSV